MSRQPQPRLFIQAETVQLDEKSAEELKPSTALFAPRPGRFVRLRVRDNGSGMSAETLKQIFELGFSTKAEKPGARGFGMSIVANTIKKSGGFLTVDSRPEEGTTFDAYLTQVG